MTITKKCESSRIINLKYPITSVEQASYETITNGNPLGLILVMTLAKKEGISDKVYNSTIDFIMKSWKDKDTWKNAINFANRLGVDGIAKYNAGIWQGEC